MGWVQTRTTKKGRERYTGMYRNKRGEDRSAGTFDSEGEAIRAWVKAEARASRRISKFKTFEAYVSSDWLPHHELELTTREDYEYRLKKYIIPYFGGMRFTGIEPSDVREWVTWLKVEHGAKPATIRKIVNIVSAVFTTAFNDAIIDVHPCRGVALPEIPKKPITVITPDQFDRLYGKLPDSMKLLVETDIEGGMRWGELIEFRVSDWNSSTRTFTIERTVVELNPKFHDGVRFHVKPYPKGKRWRRVNVSIELAAKIDSHISENHLGADDLLFRFPDQTIESLAIPDDLGYTDLNEKGRSYRHGTTSAYGAGKCRCEYCRAAVAAYRAKRRAEGKDCHDSPRLRRRVVKTDGHIPRSWFRRNVWLPTVTAAGLPMKIRPYDLRHAHASWLVAGGANIEVVRTRLGHDNIRTTQQYVHMLDDQDQTAVNSFKRVRNGSMPGAELIPDQQEKQLPLTADQVLKEMQQHQQRMVLLQEALAQHV